MTGEGILRFRTFEHGQVQERSDSFDVNLIDRHLIDESYMSLLRLMLIPSAHPPPGEHTAALALTLTENLSRKFRR